MDPLSFNCKDVLEDWIVDNEVCREDFGSSNWMSLDSQVGNRMLSRPSADETEEFLDSGKYCWICSHSVYKVLLGKVINLVLLARVQGLRI